ncbi:MAG: hypothetical protein WBW81_12025 [Methylocella sp.]
MAARLEQDAKRRAEKKPAPVSKIALPHTGQEIDDVIWEDIEEESDLDKFPAKLAELKTKLAELRAKSKQAMVASKEIKLAAEIRLLELRVESKQASAEAVEARGAALWDKAVESLGRSAGVLEKLAESTGEAIARIAARGDRIARIQKETRALLNALVTSEADA